MSTDNSIFGKRWTRSLKLCRELWPSVFPAGLGCVFDKVRDKAWGENGWRRGVAGFSLTEMVAVFAIILFLVSMVIGVSKYANRAAKENAASSEIQRIGNVLQDYFVNHGRYPPTLAAVHGDLTDVLTRWSGSFPLDPWQSLYYYTNTSTYSYMLLSRGPDGDMGTAATDADNINGSGK